MAKKENPKPVEYPEVPDKSNLKTFDLEIDDENRGGAHSQVFAYALLIVVITIVIAYYFLT